MVPLRTSLMGVSSLSTLIGPLALASAGFLVPSLAVPGRPAGGIDAMGSLQGYRVHLSAVEVAEVVDRCGYAHFAAGDPFAPLDAALFAYRQEHGAEASPPLAIRPSSKEGCRRRAAGCSRRSGHAARQLRTLASRGVAKCPAVQGSRRHSRYLGVLLADRRTLTYQPWIGRGETVAAMHLALAGRSGGPLAAHVELCKMIAADLRPSAATASLVETLSSHLRAQGSSWDAFADRAETILVVLPSGNGRGT